MRVLLESSWMKFGPAERDALDWVPGPSALPSTDRQTTGNGAGEVVGTGSVLYTILATVSFLIIFLGLLALLVWRRKQGLGIGKLDLANVIALEDLNDPERNSELLSSFRRSRGQQKFPSCSSEQDMNDGVFLMVYLPSPYEQTLTRIARAASTSSSKDTELLPPSPGPEGRSEIGSGEEAVVRLADQVIVEEELKD